ncbi:MAG: DUF6194 family protein [Pseudomonadota bacterium]|nr:DUF6194 family protein [Pseudomonadota bacterium]
MQPEDIIDEIVSLFDGVEPKASWGETSLFYNPGRALPNGVYFCTIKEKNGDNDKASKLDRLGVFRLSIGTNKETYERHFGPRPKRPAKGGIIDTGHDFAALNELMPHPIYGWMSWVQVLSPTRDTFDEVRPLLLEAHQSAVEKFNKKIARMPIKQDA